MERLFRIHFKIGTGQEGDVFSLDKVKALCSHSESRYQKMTELDLYNPLLKYEDKSPHKTRRSFYVHLKVKSETHTFLVKVNSGFNGTYVTKLNLSHTFKTGVTVKITDVESIHCGFQIPQILDGLSESHLHAITYNEMKDVVYLSKSLVNTNKKNLQLNLPLLKIVSIVTTYDGFCNQFTVFYQSVKS